MNLSDQFLGTLVAELDDEGVRGVVLGGSYARSEATIYSDVDIACFTRDEQDERKKGLAYRDGRLVSISVKTEAEVRADMLKPSRAIWVVPGLSDCRILLDKDRSIGRLLRDVRAFSWESLQQEANTYASFHMMLSIELVGKIMNELSKGNRLGASYATSKLLFWLTEIVAVQRGVLVKSDSTYYQQVQESAGLDSAWTYRHRLVAMNGADPTSRGVAALRLFQETLTLIGSIMEKSHLSAASEAARLIDCNTNS
ncbi:MAG: nucleotidyltransferase domain-containing protein [Chloroflexi bacterium]|nr:nucleotidyltransferase domain-containing protein [Chloroflexota bacterium]